MKKLGKKLVSTQDTIEAYCSCGSYAVCGCPNCFEPGTPTSAKSQVHAGNINSGVAYAVTNGYM